MTVLRPEPSLLPELFQRLRDGHYGDDVPILMADYGCDYDTACDLVFGKRFEEAIALLLIHTSTAGEA